MSLVFRRFPRALLRGLWALAGLVLLPPGALRAETSYHKLKKKLHKIERKVGDAGQWLGDNFVDGLLDGLEIGIDLDDEDLPSASKSSRASSTPPPAHSPAKGAPPGTPLPLHSPAKADPSRPAGPAK